MQLPKTQLGLVAVLLSFTPSPVHAKTCGITGPFQLQASGVPSSSQFSFVNGAFVAVTAFGGPSAPSNAAFENGSGTTFKLDRACRLFASNTPTQSAQILRGAKNKDQPEYFQNGVHPIDGSTPERAPCAVAANSSVLSCPTAGMDKGLKFYVVTGTEVQAMYEIGQPLLALASKADVDGNYTPVTLTAVPLG